MKVALAILKFFGIGIVASLALVGIASIGLFVAARGGVAPAREVASLALAGAPPVVSPAPAVAAASSEPASGIMYPATERVVNLADRGALRYLKSQVVLELAPAKGGPEKLSAEAYKAKQEETKRELSGKSAIIEDEIATVLSSRTASELVTPEGKQRAKDDLRERLGEIVAGEYRLLNVYFTQFIIQ